MKPNMLKIVKIMLYCVSAYYSYEVLKTYTSTLSQEIVMLFSVTGTEFVAFYSIDRFFKAIKTKNRLQAILFLFVGSTLTLLSIGFTLNNVAILQNTKHNEFIDATSISDKANKIIADIESQIAKKENEINRIKNEKMEMNKDYNKQIAEKPNDWLTVKDNLLKEKTYKLSVKDDSISQINAEINKLNDRKYETISNPAQYSTNKKQDTGVKPLSNLINKFTNIQEENIEIMLFAMYSIALQLSAIVVHIEESFGVVRNNSKKSKDNETLPDVFKPVIVTKDNQEELSKEKIKKYLKAMYDNRKGEFSAGYKELKEITQLSQNECVAIKKYLQDLGVIKTEGTNTRILKNKEEVAI